MKTYKNLFWAYENLYEVWRRAARRKRWSPRVAGFAYALTDNLLRLEEELCTQTYCPGPYRHFCRTPRKQGHHVQNQGKNDKTREDGREIRIF